MSDLVAEMQELQTMLARDDFRALAARANHLRGRIVRFKTEAYTELDEVNAQSLDIWREHLESIADEATRTKASAETRNNNILKIYGWAIEASKNVFAIHRLRLHGDNQ